MHIILFIQIYKMKTAAVIYFRALAIYMVLSLPALMIPFIYIISALYAFLFGWFALAVFALVYVFLMSCYYVTRIILLIIAVVLAVGFAFHMIGVVHKGDVWNTGVFLLFPIAAVIAGWISLFISWKNIVARTPSDN